MDNFNLLHVAHFSRAFYASRGNSLKVLISNILVVSIIFEVFG